MASLAWYGNFVLELHPNGSQDVDGGGFRATKDAYSQPLSELASRFQDIPSHQQLCSVIRELFVREVIEVCRISKGRKIELTISRKDSQGHVLDASTALERFSCELARIIGRELPRFLTGGMMQRAHAYRNSSARLAAIADAFDAVCEGRSALLAASPLVGDSSR